MRRSPWILLLCLAGCSSFPGSAPQVYVHDGQHYGVVHGTFRGRWWNHYERGRSYLDGGYYAEADSDFQVALALRAEDQRWARTYGLHFIPEYFPNRELGITRYHEGKLDDAERLLATSQSQAPSALAAHFLERVRAKKVEEGGGDTEAPSIQPDADSLTQSLDGLQGNFLRATISDNTYVSAITIDGTPYLLDASAAQVTVTTPLTLASGSNTVVVAATDIAGNRSELAIAIPRDYDGPAISFDPVGVTANVVSGRAFDPAGIQEMRLDGLPMSLETLSDGSVQFHAVRASATADAPICIATDRLGNVTTTPVPGEIRSREARNRPSVRLAGQIDPAWLTQWLSAAVEDAPAAEVDQIRLTNLADGQRYLMDEIVVSIEASTPDGIGAIAVDGVPLTGIVPGAHAQHLSRRIRLADFGERTVVASLTDAAGHVAQTQATIFRAPTDIEQPGERLRVALLGNLWEGAGPALENEAAFVTDELTSALFRRGRVDIVSRDALPRVLEEQELQTVLGSRDLPAGLRQIVPADLLAVGKVRRTGHTMEIVLQAVSTETSNIVAYTDVAGEVNTLDDLRALTRDLALRFEQEFPKATGLVVQASARDRCFATLSEADRVRPELPCVIYRLGDAIVHPETGAVLGHPTEIIARGHLAEVQRQMSRIALDPGDDAASAVQVSDHVAMR